MHRAEKKLLNTTLHEGDDISLVSDTYDHPTLYFKRDGGLTYSLMVALEESPAD